MANEEKILSMLESIQANMKAMQSDMDMLKEKMNIRTNVYPSSEEQLEVFQQMSKLLTKEEGDALAAAMDEIERRKFAV